VIQKHILMFGGKCTLACDAKCHKAWGINNRPTIYLDDPTQTVYGYGFTKHRKPENVPENFDYDNHVGLADDELPDAPTGSNELGTWEGGHGKPETDTERLNKWCARECERSIIVDEWRDVDISELENYNLRQYNYAPRERSETQEEITTSEQK
jgi:hypothetical protein